MTSIKAQDMTSEKAQEQLSSDVFRELNAIVDPCSIAAGAPAGLLDMGLVREATLHPLVSGGYRVCVRISVTHPFCIIAGVFLSEVEKRLRALPSIVEVDASIDSTTLWRPELMSADYRARLAAVREGRPAR
jgi:metal-sulfur cluster biosynthetic enzyme